jgi:hypothetical protein
MLTWWKSEVNRSLFLCLAACRMRSSACDTLSRSVPGACFAGPHFPWPASRTVETIVSRIQFKPTGGNNPFFRGWLAPCWNDGFNPARFQLGEDTCDAVARVQCGDCD